MKKFLAIVPLFVAFLFASCSTTLSDPSDKYPTPPIKYTEIFEGEGGFISGNENKIDDIRHFEYKGHRYIQFGICASHGGKAGVIHDPDCLMKDLAKMADISTINEIQ